MSHDQQLDDLAVASYHDFVAGHVAFPMNKAFAGESVLIFECCDSSFHDNIANLK